MLKSGTGKTAVPVTVLRDRRGMHLVHANPVPVLHDRRGRNYGAGYLACMTWVLGSVVTSRGTLKLAAYIGFSSLISLKFSPPVSLGSSF